MKMRNSVFLYYHIIYLIDKQVIAQNKFRKLISNKLLRIYVIIISKCALFRLIAQCLYYCQCYKIFVRVNLLFPKETYAISSFHLSRTYCWRRIVFSTPKFLITVCRYH